MGLLITKGASKSLLATKSTHLKVGDLHYFAAFASIYLTYTVLVLSLSISQLCITFY